MIQALFDKLITDKFESKFVIKVIAREKPERGHAAILRGTLLLGPTAALTRSIFELAEL